MADRQLSAGRLWSLDALIGDLASSRADVDSVGPMAHVQSRLDREQDPEVLDLLDAAAARAADEAAVAAGASWAGLMWTAAGHLARTVVSLAGRAYGLRVAIVVGRGNNGGDGWAAARRLSAMGAKVRVFVPEGLAEPTTELSHQHRAWWLAHGGVVAEGLGALPAALATWADVTVDAMLGTGARGEPRGALAEATRMLGDARHTTRIVACDLPTGVDSDDGSVAGLSVTADVTVTFGALKRGLVLPPGSWNAGRIVVGGLGAHWRAEVDNAEGAQPRRLQVLTARGARPARLAPDADKWARGRVLVVAGSPGMAGAAALAANAALRTGAGLVQLATPAPVADTVAAYADAGVMVRAVDAAWWHADRAEATVAELLAWEPDVVLVGPGIGISATSTALVAELARSAPRLVADADALNVARENLSVFAGHRGELVVTPQRRELSRLTATADAWQRRLVAVPALADQLDATVVAKGPGTLIAAPRDRGWIVPASVPALGSGGTGDVLAGMITAAIATTDDVPLAAVRATWWHAAAGRLAGASSGERATASDVLAAVADVLRRLDS